MKNINYRVTCSVVIVILSVCQAMADPAADVNTAIEKAEIARKNADAVGGEWRDTANLIQKAKTASQKGDVNSALELANQAQRQGELGYKQAIKDQNATFPNYMR